MPPLILQSTLSCLIFHIKCASSKSSQHQSTARVALMAKAGVHNALITKKCKDRRVRVCQKTQIIGYLFLEQRQVQSDGRTAPAWPCTIIILSKVHKLPLFQSTFRPNNRRMLKERSRSQSPSRTILRFLSGRLANIAHST